MIESYVMSKSFIIFIHLYIKLKNYLNFIEQSF